MTIHTAPNAWPPKDFETPMQLGVNTINIDIKYTPKNLNSLTSYSKYRLPLVMGLVVATFIVVNLFNLSFETTVIILLTEALILNFGISKIIERKILPKKNTETSESVKERNSQMLQELYDVFQSPGLVSLLFINAVQSGVNIYESSSSEAVDNMKRHFKKDTTIGQLNCGNGHSALCIHRIPADKRAWFISTPESE